MQKSILHIVEAPPADHMFLFEARFRLSINNLFTVSFISNLSRVVRDFNTADYMIHVIPSLDDVTGRK